MTALRLALTFLMAATLAACATVSKVDAGGDIHAFLVAVRDDDRAAFDAHVDRRALKNQLEGRLIEEAKRARVSDGWKIAGVLLAGPAADAAGDALLRPSVFRGAAAWFGYKPSAPIPNRLAIAAALKYRPDGTVCVVRRKDGPCLFVFTRQGEVWRLTGFEGEIKDLKLR